jgi:acyl-CoA synthetase (AMP-forming)/AMP-acid ligase II
MNNPTLPSAPTLQLLPYHSHPLIMSHSLRPSLPDDVLYSKLLEVAAQQGDRIIVDDRSRNAQFGYLDILNGIATLKQQLLDLIDPSILAKPGEFFVALLAPNGYEFIVGVLATLAVGGVVVPVREFSLTVPPICPSTHTYLDS